MKTNENVKSSRIIFGIVAAVVVVFIVLLFCGVIPTKDWMQSNPNNLQTDSVLKTETPIYNISVVFAGVIVAILFFYSVGAMVALFFLCITKRKGKDIVAEDLIHNFDKSSQKWIKITQEEGEENKLIIYTSTPHGLAAHDLKEFESHWLERITIFDRNGLCIEKYPVANFSDIQNLVAHLIIRLGVMFAQSEKTKEQIIKPEEKSNLPTNENIIIFRHIGGGRLDIIFSMDKDRSALKERLNRLEIDGRNIFQGNISPCAAGFKTKLSNFDWKLAAPAIQDIFKECFGSDVSFKNEIKEIKEVGSV